MYDKSSTKIAESPNSDNFALKPVCAYFKGY